jgi:3-oxoacyl-[acyl-carrier protein] reductase
MADRYQQLINTPIGRIVSKQVGLPAPVALERFEPGQPVISGPVLFGAASGSRCSGAVASVLASIGAEVHTPMVEEVRRGAADAGLDAGVFNADVAPAEQTFKALVFDATGITSTDQLREAWAFFHPTIRRVRTSGRVIVLGTPPEDCDAPLEAIAQRALEGLVRSIAKEIRKGASAQLVYVAPAAEQGIESTLRFFLSPKSAYVSGQVVRIVAGGWVNGAVNWDRPLAGKVALVTGASRGIGEAIAEVLARDGAHVVGVDVPAMADELASVTGRLGGSSIAVDITEAQAPAAIASSLLEAHGGVDVVIHNAGITRDKTLGRMSEAFRDQGRIVCVSSISGIAGNAGQANYSTSKAGVIGFVQAWAPIVFKQSVTLNAVAPGFIETQMTAAMPIATREAGRRMNSMAQGGLPIDVAETIAWFAGSGSGSVNGNIVRVCGQSLLGA